MTKSSSDDAKQRTMAQIGQIAFFLLLVMYALFTFEGLARFPPYFFCDEAVHLVEAESLRNTGKDMHGAEFPVYPLGLGQHQLSLSVYLQIPFNFLVGFNEEAVRARSAFLAVTAMIAVYLLLGELGATRFAWLTPLLFLNAPVWFLHSRTGFESFQASVFLLWTTYFYILGSSKQRKYLFLASIMAAGAFYSYIPARGWIATCGVALGLFHCATHYRSWRSTLSATIVLIVLLVPFVYASAQNPAVAFSRLQAVGLDGLSSASFGTVMGSFISNYMHAFNPNFWFDPDIYLRSGPEERHVIPTLPLLPIWMAPFTLLGLLVAVWNFRRLEFSTLLIVFFCIPLTAAPFGITNLRVFPCAALMIVFACLGFSAIGGWFLRNAVLHVIVSSLVVLALFAQSVTFRDFTQGPARLAYRDYAFYGIQYGARDLFTWAERHYRDYDKINIASNLFNAGEIFIPTYLSSGAREKVTIVDPLDGCQRGSAAGANEIWITHATFPEELRRKGCPAETVTIQTITDPRDEPLFLISSLRSVAASADSANVLHDPSVNLEETQVDLESFGMLQVLHTVLDIGNVHSIFDGDEDTVARTSSRNPLELDLRGLTALPRAVRIVVSNNHTLEVSIAFYMDDQKLLDLPPVSVSTNGDKGEVEISFQEVPSNVNRVTFRFFASDANEFGYVHVREIEFLR